MATETIRGYKVEHDIDPEKGKPTNRAFLRRMQQQVTGAMQRLL